MMRGQKPVGDKKGNPGPDPWPDFHSNVNRDLGWASSNVFGPAPRPAPIALRWQRERGARSHSPASALKADCATPLDTPGPELLPVASDPGGSKTLQAAGAGRCQDRRRSQLASWASMAQGSSPEGGSSCAWPVTLRLRGPFLHVSADDLQLHRATGARLHSLAVGASGAAERAAPSTPEDLPSSGRVARCCSLASVCPAAPGLKSLIECLPGKRFHENPQRDPGLLTDTPWSGPGQSFDSFARLVVNPPGQVRLFQPPWKVCQVKVGPATSETFPPLCVQSRSTNGQPDHPGRRAPRR